ncbi:hypothetical protein FNV43_RR20884 [Rhamnella rubrinervis]|uniref:Uncharacterized protein n=1 Tax=Rhamnella rubrinervis TaxID=2594499 RepID=A0A8K0DZM4_9ROSA|nr:hypothetical protein FNV43_RR20884 [Rhamnella rubrinervis]
MLEAVGSCLMDVLPGGQRKLPEGREEVGRVVVGRSPRRKSWAWGRGSWLVVREVGWRSEEVGRGQREVVRRSREDVGEPWKDVGWPREVGWKLLEWSEEVDSQVRKLLAIGVSGRPQEDVGGRGKMLDGQEVGEGSVGSWRSAEKIWRAAGSSRGRAWFVEAGRKMWESQRKMLEWPYEDGRSECCWRARKLLEVEGSPRAVGSCRSVQRLRQAVGSCSVGRARRRWREEDVGRP